MTMQTLQPTQWTTRRACVALQLVLVTLLLVGRTVANLAETSAMPTVDPGVVSGSAANTLAN